MNTYYDTFDTYLAKYMRRNGTFAVESFTTKQIEETLIALIYVVSYDQDIGFIC